ncbi:MAG: hypothetical protein IMZ53_11430 [Thermoplasmata archaeon]|nr:hypothetical protein [Thermoplasmata archaeon]
MIMQIITKPTKTELKAFWGEISQKESDRKAEQALKIRFLEKRDKQSGFVRNTRV